MYRWEGGHPIKCKRSFLTLLLLSIEVWSPVSLLSCSISFMDFLILLFILCSSRICSFFFHFSCSLWFRKLVYRHRFLTRSVFIKTYAILIFGYSTTNPIEQWTPNIFINWLDLHSFKMSHPIVKASLKKKSLGIK